MENHQQAVCGKEALDLLNCVAQSPYDQDKCLSLLQALRQCVVDKVRLANIDCTILVACGIQSTTFLLFLINCNDIVDH